MKRLRGITACLMLTPAFPAAASAQDLIEGHWENSKHSVIVKIERCGKAWCGVVVEATEAAKQRARAGGTPNLIGTRVLTNVRGTDGNLKGQAFDPKRNIHSPATLRLTTPNEFVIRGCALAGLICKEQRWTRVK